MNKHLNELEQLKKKVGGYSMSDFERELIESYISYAFALGEGYGLEKAGNIFLSKDNEPLPT